MKLTIEEVENGFVVRIPVWVDGEKGQKIYEDQITVFQEQDDSIKCLKEMLEFVNDNVGLEYNKFGNANINITFDKEGNKYCEPEEMNDTWDKLDR